MLIGLVGKPSAGKSTFFKGCTLAEVDIANYPFTTIKPNHGTSYVRVECVDKEFNTQCNPRFGYCIRHQRFVPVDLLDVAGLVPGAHEGKGMGNQFLDDLSQAHALIHVVDVSGSVNEKGEPVQPGSYDPANDIQFLEREIDLWYFGIINKKWERFARQVVQEKGHIHKALAKQMSGFRVTEDMVDTVIKQLNLDREKPHLWDEAALKSIATALRKQTKPMIIACNKIDVPCAEANFKRLKEQFREHLLIPCSAECELALREAAKKGLISYIPGDGDFTITDESKLTPKQKQALLFIKTQIISKWGGTGIQQVMDAAVYQLLRYMAIFPGGVNKLGDQYGNILPDCFLMPEASTALDFAFWVHSDLGNHFIRAIDVRTKKTVGKEHVLKHRDVVEIVSGK
ncbi:redox-regulated ATPase YchF [Candidatus Woesearchaeota archaeon]|nr:redox-regulated ATPase YchF [Candidatus Woesearchaeota archaeon]